jgi:hypothetical protein
VSKGGFNPGKAFICCDPPHRQQDSAPPFCTSSPPLNGRVNGPDFKTHPVPLYATLQFSGTPWSHNSPSQPSRSEHWFKSAVRERSPPTPLFTPARFHVELTIPQILNGDFHVFRAVTNFQNAYFLCFWLVLQFETRSSLWKSAFRKVASPWRPCARPSKPRITQPHAVTGAATLTEIAQTQRIRPFLARLRAFS